MCIGVGVICRALLTPLADLPLRKSGVETHLRPIYWVPGKSHTINRPHHI